MICLLLINAFLILLKGYGLHIDETTQNDLELSFKQVLKCFHGIYTQILTFIDQNTDLYILTGIKSFEKFKMQEKFLFFDLIYFCWIQRHRLGDCIL